MGLPMEVKSSAVEEDDVASHDVTNQTDITMVNPVDEYG